MKKYESSEIEIFYFLSFYCMILSVLYPFLVVFYALNIIILCILTVLYFIVCKPGFSLKIAFKLFMILCTFFYKNIWLRMFFWLKLGVYDLSNQIGQKKQFLMLLFD